MCVLSTCVRSYACVCGCAYIHAFAVFMPECIERKFVTTPSIVFEPRIVVSSAYIFNVGLNGSIQVGHTHI